MMSLIVPTSIPQDIEDVGHRVIGCGITVHRILGPGFKERIYERAFCLELEEAGLRYECEKRILVPYKRWQIEGHIVDLIIEGAVIVELKAVPRLAEIHRLQLLSYLRATGLRLGYVMNFNAEVLKQGIKRVAL
ncbi:MAG TPA: GxxExxY protein [Vicinamibacterales bacterium]|nr:GxxExxY protein [Vicinamibacterales bacterium]